MEHGAFRLVIIITAFVSCRCSASPCGSNNLPKCNDTCDDIDNVLNVDLETRQFNTIQNETIYTYSISYIASNHCVNRIVNSSLIWIEISPSYDCCDRNNNNTSFSWRSVINTSENTLDSYKFHISLQGDVYHTAQGTYWLYSDANDAYCAHDTLQVPHFCPYFDENTHHIQQSYASGYVLFTILTHSNYIIYSVSVMGIICIIFMTLIIVIICKHRRIKRYEQQIEDYHSEYRMKSNSIMQFEGNKAIGGGIGFHDDVNNNFNIMNGPLHNMYDRYSLTMDRDSSISLNIRGRDFKQAMSRNVAPQNDSNEVSVSSQCSSEPETKPLKGNEKRDIDSVECDDDDAQCKFPRGYNKVSSFDDELENDNRYKSVL